MRRHVYTKPSALALTIYTTRHYPHSNLTPPTNPKLLLGDSTFRLLNFKTIVGTFHRLTKLVLQHKKKCSVVRPARVWWITHRRAGSHLTFALVFALAMHLTSTSFNGTSTIHTRR